MAMTARLLDFGTGRASHATERVERHESMDVRVDTSRVGPPVKRIAPADLPCATLSIVAPTMAAPQPLPDVSRRYRRPAPARLIVADAAITLVERWKSKLAVLRRRSPASEAVKTLADCVQELVDAISAGLP